MTKTSDLSSNVNVPDELIKLGTYEWPRSQARQTLGHLFEKIKVGFISDDRSNAVDAKHLKLVSDEALKDHAEQFLKTALHDLLDQQYLELAKPADSSSKRRAFAHPPMNHDVLADWAKQHGLSVLDRESNLDGLSDATCIVVPKLERFFSRDYDQLEPLFDLFAALARFNGNVIVGCNSWAWRFLKQFDDAHLLFEDADTIPAFDADALAAILEHALSKTDNRKNFTSVASGEPILLRDDDDQLMDPYLENLASLSLGHPWVAVEMFFQGIAETKDTKDAPSEDLTWVDLPTACSLPVFGAEALLFGLHALMIHGSRPIEDLNQLLPRRAPNGIWLELERTGFVKIEDGCVHCAICSYPDIRSELSAAGFNLDEL